ncbi:bifunctional oligoribonuclease/PAP phosphatase NrnA [Bacillus sp. B15-48]|uniref:DHH family phosphoesterase n=1 Tax=Bacillus sp. B15-48 TaxID=1548601 RepID=UPI00193FE11B|nr:bifunctional oligoribonuclease/PAP phosphatase NrnA [Bacillus sp. B15-48]MBM4762545.1 bifunctional oligoribonuclease/PAP phosphatase NrnA [Bacillus sp. B15-48]
MKELIMNEIEKYETIIVHRHVRPDPDAYGSQGGLVEIIKQSFPEKNVYAVGKEEPSLNYMRRLDVIDDEVYQNALVIVCDTANEERICDKRYRTGAKLIKIDHHPNEDPYGDFLWVDTGASSTSEMIYEFYLTFKDRGLTLSDDGARLLFAGIVGDTGRFIYPSTTDKTFSYAGELIHYNFSRPELFNEMYELDLNVVKLKGEVLQSFETLPNGAAAVYLKKEVLKKYDIRPEMASQLVSELGSVKGIKAWVFFIEEEDQIRVRLRSKGPIINGLARKYRGGGHPLASGASIHSWDEAKNVINDLIELCK